MARAILNWSVRDLAERAGVNKNTVSRYETGHGIQSSSLASIEKVLKEAGIVFFEDDKVLGTGVGLKKRPR
jgi:transcriptional regulator with XRE-family HTH domain